MILKGVKIFKFEYDFEGMTRSFTVLAEEALEAAVYCEAQIRKETRKNFYRVSVSDLGFANMIAPKVEVTLKKFFTSAVEANKEEEKPKNGRRKKK